MATRKPITPGEIFGRLTVVREAPQFGWRRRAQCRCQCGTIIVCDMAKLRTGWTRSCGCFKREVTGNRARTHGRTNTPEYRIWCDIKKRCTNPRCKSWKDYGGRGITMCARWLRSFVAFLNDMGPRPSPKHTIERLNNNLGYSPSNCVWILKSEQMRNMSTNYRITFEGRTQCLAAWAEELRVPAGRIWNRLYNLHWSVDDAFTLPNHAKNPARFGPDGHLNVPRKGTRKHLEWLNNR